jgi:hypothetical protein
MRNVHAIQFQIQIILVPIVSRPVCLGTRQPSGAYDQIFISVRHLQVCWCWALSVTRGRIFCLQLLLGLTNTVMLGSESNRVCCIKFETLRTWKAMSPFLYPQEEGDPVITRGNGFQSLHPTSLHYYSPPLPPASYTRQILGHVATSDQSFVTCWCRAPRPDVCYCSVAFWLHNRLKMHSPAK